jgi:hypothetical protein
MFAQGALDVVCSLPSFNRNEPDLVRSFVKRIVLVGVRRHGGIVVSFSS